MIVLSITLGYFTRVCILLIYADPQSIMIQNPWPQQCAVYSLRPSSQPWLWQNMALEATTVVLVTMQRAYRITITYTTGRALFCWWFTS